MILMRCSMSSGKTMGEDKNVLPESIKHMKKEETDH